MTGRVLNAAERALSEEADVRLLIEAARTFVLDWMRGDRPFEPREGALVADLICPLRLRAGLNALEATYEIEIGDEAVERAKTVGQLLGEVAAACEAQL